MEQRDAEVRSFHPRNLHDALLTRYRSTDHVTFGEFANTGAGASGTRASFATKLSAAVPITTVLGSGYKSWVDSAWL